jgi:sugar/nucleoside kinase (ribokinase family)
MSAVPSGDAPHPPPGPTRVLCLGEALVDLISERPLDQLDDADRILPRFGGVVANVAVVAARTGARVTLAGGVGDDAWGRWLRDRLEREGVDLSLFRLVGESETQIAIAVVGEDGEASYSVYGAALEAVVPALGDGVDEAVSAASALYLSTNTLVGERERAVTMRARELALELERPVIYDPNVRLHRWRSRTEAAAYANECVPGALLVRTNEAEAELMTREDDPERAAAALLAAGARMVVVTRGARGAILRGELRADVPGVPARVLSTIGAGDVLTGVLLGKLALTDFYPAAVAAWLPAAVAEAARACERWGALD